MLPAPCSDQDSQPQANSAEVEKPDLEEWFSKCRPQGPQDPSRETEGNPCCNDTFVMCKSSEGQQGWRPSTDALWLLVPSGQRQVHSSIWKGGQDYFCETLTLEWEMGNAREVRVLRSRCSADGTG